MKKTDKKHKKERRKVNLSSKLIKIITIILVMVMTGIIFITYRGLDFIYLAVAAVRTFYAAREVESIFGSNTDNFPLKMDDVERTYEINFEIYTSDGRFVYSSAYKDELPLPPYENTSKVIPDNIKKNYEEILNLGETLNNSFKLCRDVTDGKKTDYLVCQWQMDNGYTLKLFKLKNAVDTNAKVAMGFISYVTITIVVAAMIIIVIFIRRTVNPLIKMSNVTRNMANLDFSKKCEPNNIKELSLLSDSINDMSDSLEEALVDLQQKNKKLQEDIEQEKTLDQLRQVFISSVSHELKTPIAIIQGYAEGLKMFLETDPATADKYCDTIISETERMNNLVMKLLDITKYESGEYKLAFTEFNVHEMVDDWFNRNSEILKEKGITVRNDIDTSYVSFGDSFLFYTVVNNYLSNAVSHVSNEMIIRASAEEKENDLYRISIFNTGTPIAPKDIDQIWNSFYRADKAMSRAQGRFGLGLAIVASIQKRQKFGYGVKNHEDGVEFWFDVKKKTE